MDMFKNKPHLKLKENVSGFGGLVVSMLASGTRVRGFEPGRIILSMPSFGGEVKESVPCPSSAACKGT